MQKLRVNPYWEKIKDLMASEKGNCQLWFGGFYTKSQMEVHPSMTRKCLLKVVGDWECFLFLCGSHLLLGTQKDPSDASFIDTFTSYVCCFLVWLFLLLLYPSWALFRSPASKIGKWHLNIRTKRLPWTTLVSRI